MRADVELDIGRKTFNSGLLPELIAVLRRRQPGELIALIGDEQSIGPELETWCRFTGNPLLETAVEQGRPVGLPLWGGSLACRGTGRRHPPGRLAALALHEFRL